MLEEGKSIGSEGIELADLFTSEDQCVVQDTSAYLEVVWSIFEEIGGIK